MKHIAEELGWLAAKVEKIANIADGQLSTIEWWKSVHGIKLRILTASLRKAKMIIDDTRNGFLSVEKELEQCT